jgi:hypothetical protein
MTEREMNIEAWNSEILRVTVFISEPSMKEFVWWEKLMNEPPETRLSRPKEGIYRDEGSFQSGRLVLSIAPLRIDWLYTVDMSTPEQDLPILGAFSKVAEPFYELMKAWLAICPSAKRLAFGATLLQPVSSREEGYTQISKYLPNIKLDPTNSLDFLYQINRPRLSSVIEKLSINRLSKWSVAQLQRLHFELNQEGKVSSATVPHDSLHACRLELDINTSQNFTDAFTHESRFPLFDELIALGEEIAINGDVK